MPKHRGQTGNKVIQHEIDKAAATLWREEDTAFRAYHSFFEGAGARARSLRSIEEGITKNVYDSQRHITHSMRYERAIEVTQSILNKGWMALNSEH
jgi:hypothetical protein